MELRFSQGAELPFPHQKMSGTGTDSLGAWELRAGRRYTDAHNIEWVKTYTALRSAYAQIDPTKLAQVCSLMTLMTLMTLITPKLAQVYCLVAW